MAAVGKNGLISNEKARDYWRAILAHLNLKEELTFCLTFELMDQLKHDNVVNDISVSEMIEQVVKPFCDMHDGKYFVYLEEVRQFIDLPEAELDDFYVGTLDDIDFDIEYQRQQLLSLQNARQKRLNRAAYQQGKKPAPVYTKETGQQELMQLFEIKDTADFLKAIKAGEIKKAGDWLN